MGGFFRRFLTTHRLSCLTMKLVVALALSANAFSPATPGGAKPREKAIPTSSAQSRSYSDARARRGRIDHRWTHAGARGAALRADRVFSPAEAKGGSAIDASKTALLLAGNSSLENALASRRRRLGFLPIGAA